jgi:hypothetical protein
MSIFDKALFFFLIIVDRLFGTKLVEKELSRRRRKISYYEAKLKVIEKKMAEMERKLEAINLRLCLLYLVERKIRFPENWLCFNQADPEEEKALDMLIEYLVKPGLAAVKEEETEGGRYIYHLKPDWEAISASLAEVEESVHPFLFKRRR